MWQTVRLLIFFSVVGLFVQHTTSLSADVKGPDSLHGPLQTPYVRDSQKTATVQESSSGESASTPEDAMSEHDLGQCGDVMKDRCSLGQCLVSDGKEKCECTPPFEPNNHFSCWLKRFSYILKFNLAGSNGSTLGHDDCPEASQVLNSVKELANQSEKVEILSCRNGEYNIRLVYKSEPNTTVLEGIKSGCKPVKGRERDRCNLPGQLRVTGTRLGLNEENLCDYFLKQYMKELKGDHMCVKNQWGYFLTCREHSSGVATMWSADYRPGQEITVHQCPETTTNPRPTTTNLSTETELTTSTEPTATSATRKAETTTTSKISAATSARTAGTTTTKLSTTTSGRIAELTTIPEQTATETRTTFKLSTTTSAKLAVSETTTSPEPMASNSSTETGAQINLLVVGTAGGVLLLIVLTVAIVVASRKKRRQERLDDRSEELQTWEPGLGDDTVRLV